MNLAWWKWMTFVFIMLAISNRNYKEKQWSTMPPMQKPVSVEVPAEAEVPDPPPAEAEVPQPEGSLL